MTFVFKTIDKLLKLLQLLLHLAYNSYLWSGMYSILSILRSNSKSLLESRLLSCPVLFSTFASLLSFTLNIFFSQLWWGQLVLYWTNYTTLLHSSFQTYIILSRQPESLIRDNKISLPFKSCQIPLKSRPPQPTWTCYNGSRLTINLSVLAWVSSFHWNMVQNLGSWVCGRSLYSQTLPVQEYYDPLWKWLTVKREKKKETLCVNIHGHLTSRVKAKKANVSC